ncbi:hypothetical protein J4E89_002733 [Alternaria sp. Ai002NY15]|nr:hypothetical protein J4E89_002733 [Alternaria sp. Ai002NY15]
MSHPQKSDTLASIQELNAALQNLTVESPGLGFLSLSGELRNKIYSYLANERINHDAPVNSETTSFSSTPNYLHTPAHQIVLYYENKDDVLYEPPEWNTIQRYDMGITQTCHQIREEYEVTYRQNHSMSISLDALVFSTASRDPEQPPILPLGNVRITVRESSWSTPNIDILPFLKAYKDSPSLKLHFELPEHARTAFGDLFSVRENNKWMFTPVETSIGAFLLHQATSNLLYQNGDILGLSGYLRRLFSAPTKELLAFFTGMAASYVPLKALAPQLITEYPAVQTSPQSALFTLAIGALIGWGTKTTASLLVLAIFSIFAARTIPKLVAQVTVAPSAKDAKHQPADTHTAARLTTQSFSGLLFALGLHISQMSHPEKVAAFFSFPNLQHWDPSLALVILFGVLPNLIENQMKGFTSPPSFADKFSLPTKTLQDVDIRFVVGAAAFGIGWGLTGICPGPAVLRAFFQPVWGALWVGGFWLGGKLNI